jgi:hypothetical protein
MEAIELPSIRLEIPSASLGTLVESGYYYNRDFCEIES